jgi:hypothetical protein
MNSWNERQINAGLRCLDHEDAKGTKSTKHEEHEGVRCRAHFLRVFALRVLRGLSCLRDPNTFPPIAAAFARQQYRQQGRGCIVIDVARAKDPRRASPTCSARPSAPTCPTKSSRSRVTPIGRKQVEITRVGSKSIQAKDELGRFHLINKKYDSHQLYGRPKRRKLTKRQKLYLQRKEEARVIYTPMGGQPGYRR